MELVLDPEVIVARVQGRKGWVREARHQLDEHRRLAADRSRARARSGCLSASVVCRRTCGSSGRPTTPMSIIVRLR